VINENFQVIYNTMQQKKDDGVFSRSGSVGSKKGSYVMVDGQMYTVADMSSSKTGKHGSSKVEKGGSGKERKPN